MKFTLAPPYDVAEAFPELARRKRVAVRLNPRRISRLPRSASKVGGSILWPKDEPWPTCNEHDDENFVALLQIRMEDVPELPFPRGTDLFQLLWCPHLMHDSPEYGPSTEGGPLTRICWRRASKLKAVRRAMPSPCSPDDYLMPQLCRLHPERVVEYPDTWELEEPFRTSIENWFPDSENVYYSLLSTAPGFKVGGYIRWSGCDPRFPICDKCGGQMGYLLTIDSREYDDLSNYKRWAPRSEHHLADAVGVKQLRELERHNAAAGILIGDCNSICVFVCTKCDPSVTKSLFGNA